MSGAPKEDGAGELRIAEFAFTSGALRGTWLTLFPARLLHEGSDRIESIALARVDALRVAFERRSRSIGWGVAFLATALLAFIVANPLATMTRDAADGVASQAGSAQTGVAEVLIGSFRALGALASLLPVGALALAAWGAVLIALGWRGHTTLTLLVGAAEREFAVRGRDPVLFDFAETVSQAIAQQR